MERLVLCVLVFGALVKGHNCPGRCICQNISPTLTLLCAKTGLLFVPPTIDRKTVELRLTDNFITVIRRKDFFNMTSLVHLTLSRNTISQITPQAFMGLRSLRALHMDGNRLSTIKTDHFKGLVNLRHLILGNNQIHHVAPTSFDEFVSTIEDLDLSYNNLRTLPWEAIARMTNINTLTLDHNLINHIEAGTFNLLTKLVRLDMTSNRLQKLPPDSLFQHAQVLSDAKGSNPSSLAVSFGGNPLHCNCELLWLRRLTREDDLETCASPEHLMDKYFWSIQEEEFICEPPLITKHQASKPYVMEGQGLSLKCKAMGDPDPVIHWHFPDGKLVHNNSRTILYDNGTLEILITTLKDSGAFNCVASNAAGIANASVEVNMIPLPLFVNNTGHMKEADPGLSDITTSSKSNSNDTKNQDKRVVAVDLTSSSAVIRWPSERHIPGIRMYQIQYNSTSDDTLVYRRSFAVVQWTEGEDKGTFSDVKTEAIRNYDDSKMDEDGNPVKEYVAYIEWRQGRKKNNGWPVYQGIVVFVDNNLFNISRKLRELTRTPTLALHKCQHVPKRRFDDENDNTTDIETSEPPKAASQTPMTKAQMVLEKYRSGRTDGQQTYLEDIAELTEENIKLKEENLNLKEMLVKEIPGVLAAIKNSIRTSSASSLDLSFELSSLPSRPQTSDLQMPQMSRKSSDEAFSEKIEIHPGTQVFCDKLAWDAAVNASSVSAFVQTVLMSVFPVDVLLKSNLRRQIRGGRTKRELLDSKKIDAIFRATLTKWPNATPSQIGSTIKAKLNELRNKKRQEGKQKGGTGLLFDN